MVNRSTYYNLLRLAAGDSLTYNGYEFTDAQIENLDRIIHSLEAHNHTGGSDSIVEPSTAPVLEAFNTGGVIPAGVTVYYKYTYVDNLGVETAPSLTASVTMPAAVATPGLPILTRATTGGTLTSGNYFYVLSAYVDDTIVETRAINPAYITVPVGTLTNVITITFPSLPNGATGFNIYRRNPNSSKYFYLTSVDMDVATPPTEYEDDGSVSLDCDRSLPATNSTNGQNSVIVSLPGATPELPDGYTWKVYRSYVSGDFSASFLHHVVETVSELDPTVVTEYEDIGVGTTLGAPPTQTVARTNPDQIDLTDAAEVQGTLPVGMLSGHVEIITFEAPGSLSVITGNMPWPVPFEGVGATPGPVGKIVGVRLAVDTAPSGTPVICDVNINGTTAFTTQSNRPTIPAGQEVGDFADTVENDLLFGGDVITFDIDQTGGGSPANLVANVVCYFKTGSTTTSEVYE